MINITLLAQSAEWLQKASDFCSTNWSRILGWISIPTIASILLTYVLKFIFLAVQNKKIRKANQPLVDKLTEIKATLPTAFDNLFTQSSTMFADGMKALTERVDRLFNQYNAQAQAQFEKIMGLTLGEAMEKVEAILNEPEILPTTDETPKLEKQPEEDVHEADTKNDAVNEPENNQNDTAVFAR